MKNITKLIAMAVLSTMSATVFTACTNDEVELMTIYGVWQHDDTNDNDIDFISFSADGTGAKWETLKGSTATDQVFDYETFTYTLSGNKITFIEQDGDRDVETIKVVNNDRIKLDGDTYDRTK